MPKFSTDGYTLKTVSDERYRVLVSPNELKSLLQIPNLFSRVVVISPHMDDAILSCGGLLQFLVQHMECWTLTICTADPLNADPLHPPHGIALPTVRRFEEVSAMAALGCQLVQLGQLDAIYRVNPKTGEALYPSLDSIWTMPLDSDDLHCRAVQQGIQKFIRESDVLPTLFLSPSGIGHHVDHILCTQVLLSLPISPNQILLYEDFPYVVDQGIHVGIADSAEKAFNRLNVRGNDRFEYASDVDQKTSLILHYKTQIDVIFGHQGNIRPMLLKNSPGSQTVERFWRIEKI